MGDFLTKEQRSWNMSRIRSRDTSIEIKVRKYLYSQGYRYRIHYGINGKPDIAFPKKKIAIFVNGCFWHAHSCSLYRPPKTRKAFWLSKITKNIQRDKQTDEALEHSEWKVLKIWQCELQSNFKGEMSRIVQDLGEYGLQPCRF